MVDPLLHPLAEVDEDAAASGAGADGNIPREASTVAKSNEDESTNKEAENLKEPQLDSQEDGQVGVTEPAKPTLPRPDPVLSPFGDAMFMSASNAATGATTSTSNNRRRSSLEGMVGGLTKAFSGGNITNHTSSGSTSAATDEPGGSGHGRNPIAGAAAAARDGIARLASHIRTNSTDDQESKHLLEQMQKKMEETFQHVSFGTLAKGRDLAKAAKMELHFGTSPDGRPKMAEMDEDACGPFPHDLEVERHRSVTAAVEEDAATESRLNQEMAALLVERLESARKSCEAFGRMFAGMAVAEMEYTKAMERVASEACKPVMTSASDSGLQEGGNAAILELPIVLAKSHAQAKEALKLDSTALKDLDLKIREALKLIKEDSSLLQQAIRGARVDLQKALLTHESACKAQDEMVSGGLAPGRAVIMEYDPWITETILAKAHNHLRTCLQEERSCLDAAYGRLRELELERASLMAKVSLGCFSHYESSSETIHDRAVDLSGAVKSAEEQPELQRLMEAAEQAAATSRQLAARQAENLESVATELFCSPEILRQGPMEVWDGAQMVWTENHFVLTRSGFLHWFASTEDVVPADAMNLSRCSLEAGEAPIFNVLEGWHGHWFERVQSRKVAFKASDVEDCCEWVIAIREEINSRSTRGR